jgi:RNA polymerase sigma-70 factor (ECF subfamily)
LDEAKLIRRLQREDRQALDRIIGAYTAYLSTVVWRALGPAATAEDVEEVVSDAFLSLWYSRDKLEPEQGVRSWLAAVARNRAIDRLRTAPPAPLPLAESQVGVTPQPEEDLERRMFAAALLREVEALEYPDNELVLRFYYEEEKLKDIAKSLGLSTSAAKTRLCRARKKLKGRLTKGGLVDGTEQQTVEGRGRSGYAAHGR